MDAAARRRSASGASGSGPRVLQLQPQGGIGDCTDPDHGGVFQRSRPVRAARLDHVEEIGVFPHCWPVRASAARRPQNPARAPCRRWSTSRRSDLKGQVFPLSVVFPARGHARLGGKGERIGDNEAFVDGRVELRFQRLYRYGVDPGFGSSDVLARTNSRGGVPADGALAAEKRVAHAPPGSPREKGLFSALNEDNPSGQ